MKKFVCIVLTVIMTLSLFAACNNGTASSAGNQTNAPSKDEYFVWSDTEEGRIEGLTEKGKKHLHLGRLGFTGRRSDSRMERRGGASEGGCPSNSRTWSG